MSYHLIDFTKENIDFNFDNVIIGKKIKMENISKYYLYYQFDNNPPKEIYIKLPKMRMIYYLGNQKYNQLSVPIYPNYNLTNYFIKFITELETNIKDCFIQRFPKMEFNGILKKKNSLNFIKTNINDKIKITSDLNKSNILLNDFQINGQIEMVIKLSYVWNKNDLKFGISSTLYQIKYYACPDQLDINFIDEPFVKPTVLLRQPDDNNYYPPIIPKPTHKEFPQQIRIGLPSADDLKKALKKLRPSKNNDE